MATDGARAYRPRFHYTPEKGWINDPNGLLFDGKRYHLFAQHYPHDTKWGPMHWAHAVSDDMIHWRHLPIALYPDELGMCFSGSACLYKGRIALMYTSHGETERQSVAFTEDGIHFTPYAGNPVIPNPGLRDYRDPKLFRNEARDCFGVAVAAGDHVEFFASRDLTNWEKTGEFSDQARVRGIHECPDVFPLTAPDGSTRHVMIASMIPPEGGNRTQYVLGSFDGDSYRITEPFAEPEWIDAGWDDYAAVTFWGISSPIMIGWASSWRYCDRLPTGDYAGVMTFPRALSLAETGIGLRLAQRPLADSVTGKFSATNRLPGESFRVRARADGDFSLTMKNGKGERLTVSLRDGLYSVDRRLSGECGGAPEILEQWGTASRKRYGSGKVEMDLLFDVCLLEAFADGGAYAATMSAFPTVPYEEIETAGCSVEVAALEDI